MFEIPSNENIEKCIITKETVLEKKEPELIINEFRDKDANRKELAKTKRKKTAGEKNKTA